MKLNKLVIAMGLATVALVGCNDNDAETPAENINTITAIDGYIVNGNVQLVCNGVLHSGVTDNRGLAKVDIVGNMIEDCTVRVVGRDGTYDYDKGVGSSWNHTMRSLKGQRVINPYTDIAATLSDDPTNEGKSTAELMGLVIDTLGVEAASIIGDFDLFSDFGANTTGSDEAQKVRVLAESTFATTIEIVKSLTGKDSPANRLAMFNAVLPDVTKATSAAIDNATDLSNIVFVPVITIPELVFDEDGSVDTEVLVIPPVVIETEEKPAPVVPAPTPTPTPTPTGTGTGVVMMLTKANIVIMMPRK